jgi:hypothetical protein
MNGEGNAPRLDKKLYNVIVPISTPKGRKFMAIQDDALRSVQINIIKKLEDLTFAQKIKWRLEDQTYSVQHRGLIFEIVDSGQNCLGISYADGRNPGVIIMDCCDEVKSLLAVIKRAIDFETNEKIRASAQDLYRKFISVLDVLDKEV